MSVIGFDANGATVAMHRLTRLIALARVRREGRIGSVAVDGVLVAAGDLPPALPGPRAARGRALR